MDTFFRTINESSSDPLSDRFVILAEKCLSSDCPLLDRINTWDEKISLDECVFQYPVVFRPFELHGIPERMLSDVKYISLIMLTFLQRIKIYLRDFYAEALDPLGEYLRYNEYPIIVLFPEAIRNSAKGIGMDTDILAAKVLIHELSHAFLDPCNYDWSCKDHSSIYSQYYHPFMNQNMTFGRKMNFYHVREESMANIITYRVFKMAAKRKVISYDSVKKIKLFISFQSEPYKLSLSLLPTPNIWGWVKAKTGDPLIEDQTAFDWMEKTEAWMISNPDGQSYNKVFLKQESGLNVPWAKGDTVTSYWVKRDGYYFIYDESWNPIVAWPCDSLTFVSKDKDRFLLRIGGGWRCLDKSGKEVCRIPNYYSEFKQADGWTEDLLFFATRSDRTVDIVSFVSDTSPRVLIFGIEEFISLDDSGQSLIKVKKNGKYGIYDLSRKELVCGCEYDSIDSVRKDPLQRSEYRDSYNLIFLIGTKKGDDTQLITQYDLKRKTFI